MAISFDRPFKGYRYSVWVPDKRSKDGRIYAFTSTEEESRGVLTMYIHNKGRRASQGARIVPREETP